MRFTTWQRTLFEDSLVCDCPTVYVRPEGGRPVFDILDGTTIKRVLAPDGRTPVGPDAIAYQQVLKGVPAVNFSADEIIYGIRNARSNHIYGFAPVEQLVMLVNIGLRRQLSLLAYFTEGNVPEALCSVPSSWNPDMIRQFQEYWDSLLQGNTAARRRMKFTPGDMNVMFTRDPQLKDELDDWIARLVCYCFSLSPSLLIKEQSRANTQNNKEQAQQEGLEPFKLWWKNFVDDCIERGWPEFGADYEYVYEDEEITDAATKANVAKILVDGGIADAHWIGENWYGLPPEALPEKVNPLLSVAVRAGTHDIDGNPIAQPKGGEEKDETKKPGPEKPIEKVAKADHSHLHRRGKDIDRDREELKAYSSRIERAVHAAFRAARARATHDVAHKSDSDESEWDALEKALREPLADVFKSGIAAAAEQLGVSEADVLSLVTQKNDVALAWSELHSAALVTNIEDTTREGISCAVRSGMAAGLTNDEIADRISDLYEFSDVRSEMIARTETAFADIHGNVETYRDMDVKFCMWVTADTAPCVECSSMNGKIFPLPDPTDAVLVDNLPPLHPNCRCDIVPMTEDEEAQ
jgi:SPP1 gp7 family putative phage head morphogenesis protein